MSKEANLTHGGDGDCSLLFSFEHNLSWESICGRGVRGEREELSPGARLVKKLPLAAVQDWGGGAQKGVDEGRQLLPGEQGGAVLEEEDQGEGGSAVQGEEKGSGRGSRLLLVRRGGLRLVQVRRHIVRQVGVQGGLGHRVEGWID